MHTFVIPVYKESPYLEQCIQSLLAQEIKSDIIITTSTPTDFSEKLAAKYSLPYFTNDTKGIANDWNFALSKISTPLVTIAHQDDIYEPAFSENAIAAIQKEKANPALIAFTGYHDLVGDGLRGASLNSIVKQSLLFPFAFTSSLHTVYLKKMLLAFGDPICCPSVTFNLEALQGFNFSTAFTCALDWYAWYQLAARPGAFCFINKKLVKHRIHPGSETTAQISLGIRRREELQMFKLIWGNRPAAVISWFYTLGYADNKLQTDL